MTPEEIDTLRTVIREEIYHLPARTDLGAMADGLRSGMRLLAEGHAALDERVSTLERGIVRLEKRTDSIDLNVTWLRSRVTTMGTSICRSRRRRSR